jgi:hypothetical protein
MHESIPGVTIPPRDTPGNFPDRQFTGVGNLPFIYVHGGRVLEDPGDLTNDCPESHPRGQGGVKFIVRISENYTLCHANY